jgi:hypothetical protein
MQNLTEGQVQCIRFEKLHTDRVQHLPHLGFCFCIIFQNLEIKNLEVQKRKRATLGVSGGHM